MNVYEMYVANGNKAGFWIVRDSWANTIALVRTVANGHSGDLPGDPPYFRNCCVVVDVFERSTGRVRDEAIELSCPGTYGYRQVESPAWCEKKNR